MTYRFSRSVQVAEDAPLELNLEFNSQFKLLPWQWLLTVGLVLVTAASLSLAPRR